ncbi:hypothetical protein DICVIV_00733 [Dictyocaulus viviparus]|uniref:EGF-like domain-containing protein n=1 Tax=Dictyocaulus viviparus TaxID=29172 RepID=A0A0D8Y863_DICVI|nr:hypothetical protein DICVIV_00733 [Dictyocaulus viviparus]
MFTFRVNAVVFTYYTSIIVNVLQMLRYIMMLMVFKIAETVLKRNKPCLNGELDGNLCYCRDGWTGASCHRRMNCDGFERKPNGSCVMCSDGWTGPDCDAIHCNDRGSPNYDLTSCTCEKPYSGQFCETFITKDIYSYYNRIVSNFGAIGVLSCIPLIIIYVTCDRHAKRRHRERVERHLTGTMITHPEMVVNRQAIAHLLYDDKY